MVDFELTGGVEERKKLQIANPTSFLAQKVLIHSKRSREDRARDVLYVHDTLEVFGGCIEELRAEWHTRIAPRLDRNHAQVVLKASDHLFGEITDAIRGATIIAAGRGLTPESVRETCQFGFQQLFA